METAVSKPDEAEPSRSVRAWGIDVRDYSNFRESHVNLVSSSDGRYTVWWKHDVVVMRNDDRRTWRHNVTLPASCIIRQATFDDAHNLHVLVKNHALPACFVITFFNGTTASF